MQKYRIARVARNLARQFDEMKVEEERHLPLLIEDARAQCASVGFTLESVVTAGLHHLGRVPRDVIEDVAREHEPVGSLTTEDWPSAINWAIAQFGEFMTWHDRTTLRKLLLQPELTAYEFAQAEFIVSRATYEALEADCEDEEEALRPASSSRSSSGDQPDLNV